MASINVTVAEEIGAKPWQVEAACALLDAGATVPFVARYRKEATGSLDDTQLRRLAERVEYLRDLDARKLEVLASIDAQGRLDAVVEAAVMAADTKARLEDAYAPFKPRRRTKAQAAREAGLAPLAESLRTRPDVDPAAQAAGFVDGARGVADAVAALEGARAIVAETLGEDADLVGRLRERFWKQGVLSSRVVPGKEAEGAKFSDYFERDQPLSRTKAHRVMAVLRGEREGVLSVVLKPDETETHADFPTEVAAHAGFADQGRPGDRWLIDAARWAWRTRILTKLTLDLRARLSETSEDGSIQVFATNLRNLLLASPAGAKPTMGLDPGLRTGVKVAVVDATGKVLATDVVHPHESPRRRDEAMTRLGRLAKAHRVALVAVGNGTASRETSRLVADLAKAMPDLGIVQATVSEAGASVYSASELAAREFPAMDVTLRGAVSIARRLQDPLAELVKVDPRSIGAGQYQHDVPQAKLARSLDAVVEDCVNAVGVDLNTASPHLLARVSGIGEHLAEAIVAHREAHGPFASRAALLDVSRLGPRAFELAAGFLRVRGREPLDASGVHPESYALARTILAKVHADPRSAMADSAALRRLKASDFAKDGVGLPTVRDVLRELEKPGRDPRPTFETATFAEDVHSVSDLRVGMVLEGTVTNVAAFGAFVDVGVHQDGLVHVSELSDRRVADPDEVVRTGQTVKVRVLAVDGGKGRISLSMRAEGDRPDAVAARGGAGKTQPATMGALGEALRRAGARAV